MFGDQNISSLKYFFVEKKEVLGQNRALKPFTHVSLSLSHAIERAIDRSIEAIPWSALSLCAIDRPIEPSPVVILPSCHHVGHHPPSSISPSPFLMIFASPRPAIVCLRLLLHRRPSLKSSGICPSLSSMALSLPSFSLPFPHILSLSPSPSPMIFASPRAAIVCLYLRHRPSLKSTRISPSLSSMTLSLPPSPSLTFSLSPSLSLSYDFCFP